VTLVSLLFFNENPPSNYKSSIIGLYGLLEVSMGREVLNIVRVCKGLQGSDCRGPKGNCRGPEGTAVNRNLRKNGPRRPLSRLLYRRTCDKKKLMQQM